MRHVEKFWLESSQSPTFSTRESRTAWCLSRDVNGEIHSRILRFSSDMDIFVVFPQLLLLLPYVMPELFTTWLILYSVSVLLLKFVREVSRLNLLF